MAMGVDQIRSYDLGLGIAQSPLRGRGLSGLTVHADPNIATKSQDLTDASWTKGNATITTDTGIVSPDNNSLMHAVREDGTNSIHEVSKSISLVNGTTYGISFYARPALRQWISLGLVNFQPASVTINYNLSTAAIGIVGATGAPAIVSNVVRRITGDIVRIELVAAYANTSTARAFRFVALTGDVGLASWAYTGQNADSFHLWGLHVAASPPDNTIGPYFPGV